MKIVTDFMLSSSLGELSIVWGRARFEFEIASAGILGSPHFLITAPLI